MPGTWHYSIIPVSLLFFLRASSSPSANGAKPGRSPQHGSGPGCAAAAEGGCRTLASELRMRPFFWLGLRSAARGRSSRLLGALWFASFAPEVVPRLGVIRFNLFVQQKCGFRKAPRKVEPRRSDTGLSGGAYKRSALIPPVEETVFDPSPYPIRTLIKPFFFTVGFTGCAFGSAAIWQYESLKSRVQSYFDGIKADWLDSVRPQKKGDLRKEVKINLFSLFC